MALATTPPATTASYAAAAVTAGSGGGAAWAAPAGFLYFAAGIPCPALPAAGPPCGAHGACRNQACACDAAGGCAPPRPGPPLLPSHPVEGETPQI